MLVSRDPSHSQNSKEAPVLSKRAPQLTPQELLTKSPSWPITARGSGVRCKLPQWGTRQNPSRHNDLVHFWTKMKTSGANYSEYYNVMFLYHAGFSESSSSLLSLILFYFINVVVVHSSSRDRTGDIDPQWCNVDCCM